MEQNLKSILDSQSLDSVPKLQAFARERLPLLGTTLEHLIGVGNHPIIPALTSIEETIAVGIRLRIKTNRSEWLRPSVRSPKTPSQPFLSAQPIFCHSASPKQLHHVDRSNLDGWLVLNRRWILSPQRHRNYIAGWLKTLRKTTRWLPPWRHRVRRFGRRIFVATLSRSNR